MEAETTIKSGADAQTAASDAITAATTSDTTTTTDGERYAFGALLQLLSEADAAIPTAVPSTAVIGECLGRLARSTRTGRAADACSLQQETDLLERQLSVLARREYGQIASALAAADAVRRAVGDIQRDVAAVVQRTARLRQTAGQLGHLAGRVVPERNNAQRLLDSSDRLVDLLELPKLVETCIRNGYYAEAIDLAKHARRVGLRCGPDRAFVQHQLIDNIDTKLDDMARRLALLLRSNIKLPAAIKVLSYIRILTHISQPEAKYLFVASRSAFLSGLVSTLDPLREDPFRYLKRYIELVREHVFGTYTMLRSLFPEEGGGSCSSRSSSDGEQLEQHDTIVPIFTNLFLSEFIAVLQFHMSKIQTPSLRASLLSQLLYCAQSMGRVGVDFEFLLEDVFGTEQYRTERRAHDEMVQKLLR